MQGTWNLREGDAGQLACLPSCAIIVVSLLCYPVEAQVKRIILLASALILLFPVAGCRVLKAVGVNLPVPIGSQATAAPRDAAAIVNGQAIPKASYEAQLEMAISGYTGQPGVDANSEEGQAALGALREQVLGYLIDQVIIEQAAKREGIKVDEAQVAAEVERIRSENSEGFVAWLKANGLTEESLTAQVRSDLLSRAVRDLVTKDVGGDETLSADQLKTRRDEAFARWLEEERAKAEIEKLVD